jgi:HK97 gp10 family phage protein
MDGVTKQLSEYFKQLEQVGDKAIEAIKEQIDIEADSVEKEIRENTPQKTGGLASSFTKTKIDTGKRYGYMLEYEGNAPDGTPYAKIANILNSGTSEIKPRRFITKAVRKLRELDMRITKKTTDTLGE